ncbi:MAG: hypothetical protein ACK5SI_06135 [Planctomycetia bacterium]|jgi:hypothetical protein
MRRPLLKLVIIFVAIFVTAAITYAPLLCLNAFAANLYRTRAFGWSDPAHSLTPREPYDVHFDRMLMLLPFCPSVKEVRVVPVSEFRRRLARLARSPWVVSLDLSYSDIVDEDLAVLADMTHLEYIYLEGNPKLTDAGITHLARCVTLRHLDLRETSVTGTGFAALAGCQELRTIDLTQCPVTDETVVQIPRFAVLDNIYLGGTQITDTGARHFLEWTSLDGFGGPEQITEDLWQEFKKRWRQREEEARRTKGTP